MLLRAAGMPAKPRGLNSEGLRRRGFPEETVRALKDAYRKLYRKSLTLESALQSLDRMDSAEVATMSRFIKESTRGVVR